MESIPFNRNRFIALIVFLIGGTCAWYGLILISNPPDGSLIPSKTQWLGLLFTLVVGVLSWTGKCLTILSRA